MPGFYDIAYAGGLVLGAPIWLLRSKARRKVVRALRERMGHVPERSDQGPAVLIHAVSLGEMNATRAMVQKLREARPDLSFIISTTTDTGFERAQTLYGKAERTTVIRYPLDLTPAVNRVLDRLRPSVVVLLELEIWPNFVKQCKRRNIPVIVVNARLTTGSFRNYRMGGPLVRWTFERLKLVCAQDETYAERFRDLGVPSERVKITGTMKFDNAQIADHVEGDQELAQALALKPGEERLWVCGSTGPGEEALVLDIYRRLVARFPSLRLVIVPRHPERFEEVATLIQTRGFPCLRRSRTDGQKTGTGAVFRPVVLGDTMGELRKFYSLADVVFVGRSLVDLGPRQNGSDMIEPTALAKITIVGPWTQNFADAMARLKEADAVIEVKDAAELQTAIQDVLAQPDAKRAIGLRAKEIVRQNQGATDRHVRLILDLLAPPGAS